MLFENNKKLQEEKLIPDMHNHYIEISTSHQNNNVNVNFFSQIFNLDNIKSQKSALLLQQIKGIDGLLKILRVNPDTGLHSEQSEDLSNRINTFGRNDPILKNPKNLLELIVECMEDPMLRILLIAAIVSLIIGVAEQGFAEGWMEGFSIFLAVFIVVSISALLNLDKEMQFAEINKENEKKTVFVKRNKKKSEISAYDLLVGDLIYLEIGNIVPVDCILLEGAVEVDESSLTGESELISRSYSQPFLLSGSKINDGECIGCVCAVGVNSFIGKAKLQIQESDDKTPLQEKLLEIATHISNFGWVLAALILVCIVIKEIITRLFFTHLPIFSLSFLDTFVTAFILAVVVVVVAIPEGLPMSVTISLAYSVLQMKSEGNLVRHINSSETMGNVNNICTDKTGTLTEGVMHIRSFFFDGDEYIISNKKTNKLPVFSNVENQASIFIKSILNNISVIIEAAPNSKFAIKGNSTETALVSFLIENSIEITDERFLEKNLQHRVPFKSENKYMGTLFLDKNNEMFRGYVKGAYETLFPACSRVIWHNQVVSFSPKDSEPWENCIAKCEEYASLSERIIVLAYCEIRKSKDAQLFNFIIQESNSQEIFHKLMSNKIFVLLSILGLADPPRADVPDAIRKCQSAGVCVRMVTGDNIHTALAIAKEIGIIRESVYNESIKTHKDDDFDKKLCQDLGKMKIFSLEGQKFHEYSGGYKKVPCNDNGYKCKTKFKYCLNDRQRFQQVTKHLKVIARCSPDDKFLLVLGLKELDNIVAVTGDGTNDAPALKKSDVGFSMGKKGTQIAKDASDIVLLNDSFSSVITAIKYGRNVYDCIRKFIQFQLTTNIVAVFMTLLGSLVLKDAPLSSIQMLWVNLIMDSLASLALSTEPPSERLLERMPYPRNEPMITQSMIKNVIYQSVFQMILLTVILFYGDIFFDVPSDRALSHFEWNEINGYHFTIFFDIFVFLQIFNSINARKLEQNELNVFEGIFHNKIYLSVQCFIAVTQLLFVQYGGRSLRTKPLTVKQHLICALIASSSLIVSYLSKIAFGMAKVPTESQIMKEMERSNSIISASLQIRSKSFKARGIGIDIPMKKWE